MTNWLRNRYSRAMLLDVFDVATARKMTHFGHGEIIRVHTTGDRFIINDTKIVPFFGEIKPSVTRGIECPTSFYSGVTYNSLHVIPGLHPGLLHERLVTPHPAVVSLELHRTMLPQVHILVDGKRSRYIPTRDKSITWEAEVEKHLAEFN